MTIPNESLCRIGPITWNASRVSGAIVPDSSSSLPRTAPKAAPSTSAPCNTANPRFQRHGGICPSGVNQSNQKLDNKITNAIRYNKERCVPFILQPQASSRQDSAPAPIAQIMYSASIPVRAL